MPAAAMFMLRGVMGGGACGDSVASVSERPLERKVGVLQFLRLWHIAAPSAEAAPNRSSAPPVPGFGTDSNSTDILHSDFADRELTPGGKCHSLSKQANRSNPHVPAGFADVRIAAFQTCA